MQLYRRFINEKVLSLPFEEEQKIFMENLIKEAKMNGFQVWLEGKDD